MKKPDFARAHASFLAPLALSAALALLAGCAAPLPRAPERPDSYDLGLPTPASPSATHRPALALAPVTAPATLDGPALLYRLTYKGEADQPRPYARARWSMTPPELLDQRLREALAASRAVVGPGEGLAALELRVHLDDFSQIFESEKQSQARVQLRATLIAPQASPRLLGQRTFTVQRPADTPDAAGGARAITAATDTAIADLTAWLDTLAPPASRK